MSDRLGLIYAIHEQPADDLPRLAYADWLEEQGDSDHAEFIRVEVQLSHLDRDHDDYRTLFEREIELIRKHKDKWFGKFRSKWSHYDLRRGFIDQITANSADAVLPHADWLFSHHALQDVWVYDTWANVRTLLSHPLTGVLGRLGLVGNAPGFGAWYGAMDRDLPLTKRPFAVALIRHRGGSEIIDDLLAAPAVVRVTWLDLSANELPAVGLRKLLDSLGRMPRLKTLVLAGYEAGAEVPRVRANIGPAGIDLLANHPGMAQLDVLDISHNNLSSDNVTALTRSSSLKQVKSLRIRDAIVPHDRQRLVQAFNKRVDLPAQS